MSNLSNASKAIKELAEKAISLIEESTDSYQSNTSIEMLNGKISSIEINVELVDGGEYTNDI